MASEFSISFNRHIQSRICGSENLRDVAALLEGEREIFVVYDENVSHVAAEVIGVLDGVKGCIAIDTSEELKTMDTAVLICRQLMEADASRKALVLAVGGGITTDLTGFAATIYKRGVRYANIPTTLLAQVDAAIGGKTGVNFDGYKNMLGAIVQPQFTFICPAVLKSLPARELKAGLAELLKTFLIADSAAYSKAVSSFTDGKTPEIPSADLILKAAAIKAAIVERDPYEAGERAKLNLGHTFAHAIEHEARMRGDDVVHGEAVAIGIIMAAGKAEREGIAENGLTERLKADFNHLGLPTECPYDNLEFTKDKKAAGEKVTFILPVKPGEVIMKEYDLHHYTE
ncbi:MAG: 3-dehydroquinate synthase [Bacteroidales bacterium]|nr:3-dehydroquinate synthase [Bacteroidales bacterium]